MKSNYFCEYMYKVILELPVDSVYMIVGSKFVTPKSLLGGFWPSDWCQVLQSKPKMDQGDTIMMDFTYVTDYDAGC